MYRESFWDRNGDILIFFGLISAIFLAISLLAIFSPPQPPEVPRCPEDSVIVGFGEFEDGLWDYYGCGPAVDDYTG
jgi:hypothetical protein